MNHAMKIKIKKWLPFTALPLILAACFTLWFASDTAPAVAIESRGDTWDLRGFDFSGDKSCAKLVGPVSYIPNELLMPEEFDARKGEIIYGYPEDSVQYSTSRMRVLVPDGYYAFYCHSIDFSERLYVNGNLIFDIGKPGDSRETTVPDTRYQVMTLTPVDGVIEIVQQSSNFVHREGGGHAGWKVGNAALLLEPLKSNFATNIVMGCFLALFIVHMILYLLLRNYRANLYFAFFCFIWLLRTGVTGPKVFSTLFPSMSWFVKFRIEYLAFPVTAMLIIVLIHTLFPGILHKWFLYAVTVVTSLFAVMFLFADTVFMSWSILYCEGIFTAAILYIIVRFIRKLRGPNMYQGVFLAGVALFIYASINDMLYYNNASVFPFIGADLSKISMLAFAFFEAVAVFMATVREFERAKAEEQRLAARIQITERQIDLQREQYARLTENAEQIKAARHDLRHQLAVIRQYNESGEPDKLGEFLDGLTGGLPASENLYCANYEVNAVVNHYISMAQNEGIRLDLRLDIPEKTGQVSSIDLCVITGNLLENAVEACRCVTACEKYIKLKAYVYNDYLTIVMDNSTNGAFEKKGGIIFSSKRTGEGIGLSSIEAIAKKYNGTADFKAKDNVFLSSIVILMTKNQA